MRRSLNLLLLLSGVILIAGCYEAQETTRYAALTVPEYSGEDYYNLLSDKNPEVVYNAICNLLKEASSIGRSLSDDKADKDSKEYLLAQGTYKKMLELLKSRNDKILSVSLRFLQLFNQNYSKKNELIGPILKVRSNNFNTQYEQVSALSEAASRDSKIDRRSLRKFLNSRSWLVSRCSYYLVDSLEDDESRLELTRRYSATNSQMEKLLILVALKNNFSNNVFGFLVSELLSAKDLKIRSAILKMLDNGQTPRLILGWIDKNYAKLSKEDIATLVNVHYETMEETFSADLLAILINKGLVPEEKFLKKLFDSIEGYKVKNNPSETEKESLANLMKIESAIMAKDSIKDMWLSVKNKIDQTKKINSQMAGEYNDAADQFIAKTDEILKKYNIDDEKRQQCLEDISMVKGYLVEKLGE